MHKAYGPSYVARQLADGRCGWYGRDRATGPPEQKTGVHSNGCM